MLGKIRVVHELVSAKPLTSQKVKEKRKAFVWKRCPPQFAFGGRTGKI